MKVGDVQHAHEHYEKLVEISNRYLASYDTSNFGFSLMFEHEKDCCYDRKVALEEKIRKAHELLEPIS